MIFSLTHRNYLSSCIKLVTRGDTINFKTIARSQTTSILREKKYSDHFRFPIRTLTMPASAPELISFIHSTPTPFHLVTEAEKLLTTAGFTKLDERELWGANKMIVPGGKYFYHRNLSTIVAFTVGDLYKPGGEFKVMEIFITGRRFKLK